jgi:hypothetical protein
MAGVIVEKRIPHYAPTKRAWEERKKKSATYNLALPPP